ANCCTCEDQRQRLRSREAVETRTTVRTHGKRFPLLETASSVMRPTRIIRKSPLASAERMRFTEMGRSRLRSQLAERPSSYPIPSKRGGSIEGRRQLERHL